MNIGFGEWITAVTEGRRPGAALVVSGPEGSGKGFLTESVVEKLGCSVFEASTRTDLVRPSWSLNTVVVAREDVDPKLALDIVSHELWVASEVLPGVQAPTPLALVIETLHPERYTGRRFVHIRLGDTE